MRRVVAAVASVVVGVVMLTGAATTPAPQQSADPVRSAEYWLDQYGITEAWKTTRGAGQKIAIIDTGIARGPVEFSGAVAGGTDVSGVGAADGRTPVGAVDSNHGSWVASLAAARGTGDGTGMIGVAPDAELLSISVGFGSVTTKPFTEQIVDAIHWAVDQGATVINMSLTTNTLDGLPLAIELAAARARTLTLAEIDAGLSDRFALLAHGPRLSPGRHRTLRALIDWSWDTLTDPERVGLRLASVFPDGIGSGDADAVARAFDVDATVLDALVDRSLLVRRDGRFRLLETVREYGLDRLRAEGAEAVFRERAADVLTVLAAAREATMRGPGLGAGLAWFDANEENLSSALRTRTAGTDRRPGRRLLRALLWAWAVRERVEELRPALAAFADPDAPLDDEPGVVIAALALFSESFPERGATPTYDPAVFAERRAALEEAARRHPSDISVLTGPLLRLAQTVLEAAEGGFERAWHVEVADDEIDAAPLWSRATLHMLRAGAAVNAGDTAALGIESERALRMFTDAGDPWGTGIASQLWAEWLMLEGRLEEALEVTDRALEVVAGLTSVSDLLQQRAQAVGILLRLDRLPEARSRATDMEAIASADGSVRALTQARMASAQVDLAAGDGAAALRRADEMALDPGFPEQITAWARTLRAEALLLLGRHDDARAALREALPLAVRSRDHPVVSTVLVGVAGWNAATGRTDRAREALARAEAVRGAADERDPFRRWVDERLGADAGEVPASAPGIPLGEVDADVLLALLD